MAIESSVIDENTQVTKRQTEWHRFRRVFFSRGVVVFGMVVILLFVLIAILAPWITPYDPYDTDMTSVI